MVRRSGETSQDETRSPSISPLGFWKCPSLTRKRRLNVPWPLPPPCTYGSHEPDVEARLAPFIGPADLPALVSSLACVTRSEPLLSLSVLLSLPLHAIRKAAAAVAPEAAS